MTDIDEMLNNLDLAPILDNRVRQVKWLYNNSNKHLRVYEEKLVRVMVHKLQERIKELEGGDCKTFAPDMSTTSATICRICGKEKWQHEV